MTSQDNHQFYHVVIRNKTVLCLIKDKNIFNFSIIWSKDVTTFFYVRFMDFRFLRIFCVPSVEEEATPQLSWTSKVVVNLKVGCWLKCTIFWFNRAFMVSCPKGTRIYFFTKYFLGTKDLRVLFSQMLHIQIKMYHLSKPVLSQCMVRCTQITKSATTI